MDAIQYITFCPKSDIFPLCSFREKKIQAKWRSYRSCGAWSRRDQSAGYQSVEGLFITIQTWSSQMAHNTTCHQVQHNRGGLMDRRVVLLASALILITDYNHSSQYFPWSYTSIAVSHYFCYTTDSYISIKFLFF